MSQQLVANELLAFLQQKLDVMDEVSAIQICKSSFSEDDISVAKKLLFESVNRLDKMVSRRRDGTSKSLQDIITLLKEIDPDDVPTFVAKDLNKLPPVTFDHVDVTSLLKDIVVLKGGLQDLQLKFDASQGTVSELRKEVDDLRASLALSRSSADASTINMRRGACVSTPVSSVAAAELSSPPPLRVNAVSAVSSPRASASAAPRPSPPASAAAPPACVPPSPMAQRVLPAVAVPKNTRRNFAAVVANSVPRAKRPSPKTQIEMSSEQRTLVGIQDEQGFVKVQKRVRRKRATVNHCGTAPSGTNFLLRAATPSTAMYLSRLHYTVKAEDVIEYIRKKTNFSLRVQQLESRHNAYFKAFVVRVPTFMLEDTFMKETFWPQGVVYRRFRGRVPDTTTS